MNQVATGPRAAPPGDAVSLLDVRGISVHFGGIQALAGLSFTVGPGTITSLIGPNGAGKTTAFNVITGFIPPDEGQVVYRGEDITRRSPHEVVGRGLVRSFQELRLFAKLSALDNVQFALPDRVGERFSTALFGGKGYRGACRADRERALELLAYVGLTDQAGVAAEDLSYGEQKLLSLARLLATNADLLLLDEPTSGLDGHHIDHIFKLVRELVSRGKTILLIEHNVDVIVELSDWIFVLHEGKRIVDGPPAAIMADETVLSLYLGE